MRESAATTTTTAAKLPSEPKAAIRLASVDLDAEWPALIGALELVRKRGARWPVWFVANALAQSRAAAFRFERAGELLAYMVVERLSTFDVALNVWAFAGDFDGDASPELVDEVVALIDQLARNVGANRWRAEGRGGWARVLRERASRTFTVIERDVT